MSNTKRADGWWYPWLFVAGFGVVIVVNGIMAYIAVDSWTGLETKNPFQRGQAYNAELAQKSAQAELGWSARIVFEAGPGDGPSAEAARAGVLRFRIIDRQGQGVDGLSVEALAVRPTSEGHDQALSFTAQGSGVYVAPAQLPLPGQWDMRITATRGDDVFKMRQRIQAP